VAVPAEAARDEVAGLRGVAADDVLDGAGGDVAVVRRAGGEGRPVVEGVGRQVPRLLQLLLEGVDALPVLQRRLLLLREVDPLRR